MNQHLGEVKPMMSLYTKWKCSFSETSIEQPFVPLPWVLFTEVYLSPLDASVIYTFQPCQYITIAGGEHTISCVLCMLFNVHTQTIFRYTFWQNKTQRAKWCSSKYLYKYLNNMLWRGMIMSVIGIYIIFWCAVEQTHPHLTWLTEKLFPLHLHFSYSCLSSSSAIIYYCHTPTQVKLTSDNVTEMKGFEGIKSTWAPHLWPVFVCSLFRI